jgi:hypothetical protein
MNMKTIDLAAGMPSLREVLDLARQGNVILRRPDGAEYILADVDEFPREVALARQNEELMAFLDERSNPGRTYDLPGGAPSRSQREV